MASLTERLFAPVLGMWRHRWSALAVMWAVALLGFALVWAMRDVYKVASKVYVDSETVLRPLLSGLAVGTDVDTDLEMMTTLLMSRPNLEIVAKQTGLLANARTERERAQVVIDLSRQLYLVGDRDGTYTLSYRHTDPVMAHRVVSTLLDDFVNRAMGLKRTDTIEAQRFLLAQIKTYETRLRAAEAALADFKQRNLGLMPGQTGDYYTRIQNLMSSIEALQARSQQLNQRRIELERQLDGEAPSFGVYGGTEAGIYDGQIAELQRKIDQLLTQYTDRHPDIVSMREQIARLRRENERLRETGEAPSAEFGVIGLDGGGGSRATINPVYQSIRVGLSQTNAELAEIRGQIGQQASQLAALRSRVNVAPEIEAQLAALNRDYEVNRAQYTALMQRLESARISEQAESNGDKLKFRVVEPPILPLAPDAPNRLFLFIAVTVLAGAAGFIVAFLLNLLRPVFSNRNELQSEIGLRVLGAISKGWKHSRRPWYRTDLAAVALCSCLLLVVCVGNVFLWKVLK